MIVLGADMHKRSHTLAAVGASTGELLGERRSRSASAALPRRWPGPRGLGDERVWALEDCRHVSGAFERFLLVHGERVVRVATRLMAGERRAGRDRGKSDRIDALAVARAALREGVERLPVAQLAGVELDIRLLVDHRERLVRMRTALYNDLLWHLHDLWPEQRFPAARCCRRSGATRIARRLARAEQTARVRIARDELRHLRELSHTIDALEAEIAELVAQAAPQLLAEPGFGPLTAASSSARSPAPSASPPTPSSPAPAASRRSRSARATPTATASTAAATARSTPPSTASPSPAPAATPRPRPTSPANAPKARPPRGHPLPQAPPRPPHLAPAPAAPPRPAPSTSIS